MPDLFDFAAEPLPAAASDPATSHAAAREITADGTRARQCGEVLAALRGHPLSTSFELARSAGLDRYACARRLPELERMGHVRRGPARKCAVSGKSATTWEVVQ